MKLKTADHGLTQQATTTSGVASSSDDSQSLRFVVPLVPSGPGGNYAITVISSN